MSIALERGYRYEVTDVDIRLSSDIGTPCVWTGTAITALIATLNDGAEHMLVVDFENAPSTTNWTLLTSLDGTPFVSQGFQSGCGVATVDTNPRVELNSAAANAYLDEATMWVNPTPFTSGDLANMFSLGSAGQPLDGFTLITTTAPGVTTTAPGSTTTAPMIPHPADTTVGGLAGNSNFQIEAPEILAYAAAFLDNDGTKFPLVLTARTAYVLRGAAIFLANFQGRYQDAGTTAPVDSSAYAARWQELPDI